MKMQLVDIVHTVTTYVVMHAKWTFEGCTQLVSRY